VWHEAEYVGVLSGLDGDVYFPGSIIYDPELEEYRIFSSLITKTWEIHVRSSKDLAKWSPKRWVLFLTPA
jgi:hypothetical protein